MFRVHFQALVLGLQFLYYYFDGRRVLRVLLRVHETAPHTLGSAHFSPPVNYTLLIAIIRLAGEHYFNWPVSHCRKPHVHEA